MVRKIELVIVVVIAAMLIVGGYTIGCYVKNRTINVYQADLKSCQKDTKSCKSDLETSTADLKTSKANLETCKADQETCKVDLNDANSAKEKLQADNDALLEKEKLLEQQKKVFIAILEKWRLTIPEDKELETFDIGTYFCKHWCHWVKDELPKVRKDAKDSCPSCEQAKTPVRHTCTNCQPRKKREEAPTPPPPQPPPQEKYIQGPTAPCPTPKEN